MEYNRHNFYKKTFCIFKRADESAISGLRPDFVSRSGSQYYFTDTGVYRKSSHWGRAAKCKWRLVSTESGYDRKGSLGFANWTDFCPDADYERLYWIAFDEKDKTLNYYHKLDPSYTDAVLRTADETSSLIRKIRSGLKKQTDEDAAFFVLSQLRTPCKSNLTQRLKPVK